MQILKLKDEKTKPTNYSKLKSNIQIRMGRKARVGEKIVDEK